MITELRLENFKGHVDTKLSLKRLTMLVGDNGSGKSSVLEALRLPAELMSYTDRSSRWAPPDSVLELLHRGASGMTLSLQGAVGVERWSTSISIAPPSNSQRDIVAIVRVRPAGQSFESFNGENTSYVHYLRPMLELVGDSRLFRLRPEQVAAAAYSDQPDAVVAEDGGQTAVVLAALKLADDEVFERIELAMRRLVPVLKRVRIKPAKVRHPAHESEVIGSKLYFDFQGAQDVPAHHASHGTLVVLSLLTVMYGPKKPAQILLDDFDQALHPRAQMELVRMLKELLELPDFKETQLIATTHSPYVLDELEPENVIAFALRDDGSVASKPLSEHPDAAKTRGALKSGELWSLDAERNWVLT